MNRFQLACANVLALRKRLYGLVALVSIAAGVCLAALGVADRAQATAVGDVRESYANRSVRIDPPDEDRTDALRLNEAGERKLRALPGVASVQHRVQVSFGLRDERVEGALLYATTYRPALAPRLTATSRDKVFPLRKGEILLPSRAQGMDLSGELGRKVTVETTRFVAKGQGEGAEDTVTVVGLFDPSWQMDGPDAAYADESTVLRWAAARAGVPAGSYTRDVGYDQAIVVAETAGDVPRVQRAVQKLGYPATTLRQELSALPSMLEMVRVSSQVLVAVLGVLAFAGAIVVTGALSRQRVREIGILKAVGFRTRSVLALLVTEMALAGLVAAVLGIVLGAGMASAAAAYLRSVPETAAYLHTSLPFPPLTTALPLLVLLVAVVVAGALFPARRAAAMPPTDAMKNW